jgi:hypothetical protein
MKRVRASPLLLLSRAPWRSCWGARARISYRLGGSTIPVDSTWADFTVYPQPHLGLTYVLPRRAQSDDPFTPALEPPVPYALGTRIHNARAGAARSVRIVSAQPRIVENTLGLLIDFTITGSEVAGVPGPGSPFINFGDISPATCTSGAGVMQTTLSGWFTGWFSAVSASFTHSDRLGGADTSVLRETATGWMLHRVRAEAPGTDPLDALVVETADAPPTTRSLDPRTPTSSSTPTARRAP